MNGPSEICSTIIIQNPCRIIRPLNYLYCSFILLIFKKLNHKRMIRLQYHNQLDFPDYQQNNDLWFALLEYQNADWITIIQLWK